MCCFLSLFIVFSSQRQSNLRHIVGQSIRSMSNVLRAKIKAILIDLSGTLHIENEPTVNAVAALNR